MPPRRLLRLALLTLLTLSAGTRRAARAERPVRVYDPEIALLVLDIQKESIPLLASELSRQSEWMGLTGVKILVDYKGEGVVRELEADLEPDSDVLQGFRDVLVNLHPGEAPAIEQLINEVRRYHNMPPGPPLEKLALPPRLGASPRLISENGVGSDVENELFGAQTIKEPVAFAERRFGSTGPFLRRRRWNIDFYLGEFPDLLSYYWRMGYRVFYRLRAPYISYSKSAYVLAPEGKLRPRLVYCGFYGRDYFRHVRAQYAVLARNEGAGATVRTLQCPDCPWTHPGVLALRRLLAAAPYTARNVVMGYTYLFEKPLEARRLGVYENEYWRMGFYELPAGVTATLEGRHTGFGEVSALALTELARRGAQRIFYAGPAAAVGADVASDRLYVPQEFLDPEDAPIPLRNVLPERLGRGGKHQSVGSPLFVTSDWLSRARGRGVETVDCEASVIAGRLARFNEGRPQPVELGLAVVTSELADLHPDEDRSVYTVEYETEAGREHAKRAYRDAVLKLLDQPAPKPEEL